MTRAVLEGTYDSDSDDEYELDIVAIPTIARVSNLDTHAPMRLPIPTAFTAAELLLMDIPPQKWAIPGLLPEGLSLLVGPIKGGKSWMALDIAIATATGGLALESLPTTSGDVLYLALEDSARRLQSRLTELLASLPDGNDTPDLTRLTLRTQWRRLDDGCLQDIEAWLAAHTTARLVIIDVLAKIRPQKRGNDNAYASDYADATVLQRVALDHGVAVLVLHHTRKLPASDPVDSVNATTGLAGACDSVLILRRAANTNDATLYMRGRDVEEKEIALRWNRERVRWSIDGNAPISHISPERIEIQESIKGLGHPVYPRELYALIPKSEVAIRMLLGSMARDGHLTKTPNGRYDVPIPDDGEIVE